MREHPESNAGEGMQQVHLSLIKPCFTGCCDVEA